MGPAMKAWFDEVDLLLEEFTGETHTSFVFDWDEAFMEGVGTADACKLALKEGSWDGKTEEEINQLFEEASDNGLLELDDNDDVDLTDPPFDFNDFSDDDDEDSDTDFDYDGFSASDYRNDTDV